MTIAADRAAWTLLSVLAVTFATVTIGGIAGVVWWWGVGFDEAEARGMATPSTQAAMEASFWIATGGLAGLTATGVAAVARSVRRR